MKILRNVVLLILPVILMINLYRYTLIQQVNDGYLHLQAEFVFHGVSYLYRQIGTFPGVSGTINVINTIQNTATSFHNVEVNNLSDIIDVIKNFFTMVGLVFSVPMMLVVDLVRNLLWFIGVFGIG